MKLRGAEIIIKMLERFGIKEVAGIPGGTSLPLYDALYRSSIKHILARHEQGAAFIAQGMARSSGKTAVCFATSGPGATNLLTAIADAKLDSVPIIAITGQVSYNYVGTDSFQEVDTYGLTIPITKHNFLVRTVDELLYVIPEAFKIAQDGRPGPVLIDIPKDVQEAELEFEVWPIIQREIAEYEVEEKLILEAAKIINAAERPILYVGGGIANSDLNTVDALYKLAKKNNIPVTYTLMGLGSFPVDDPLNLCMLGMHGARYTNLLMNDADLIMAFGVRFDDRAICNVKKFCPDAKIMHVDIDDVEIDKIKKADLSINGDAGKILDSLVTLVDSNDRKEWIKKINEKKEKHPFRLPDTEDAFHPINIIKKVSEIVPEDTIVTTDVGQHQMWAAQAYPVKMPRTFLTSGGLGTMGFGLPAAIGAAVQNPSKKVVCFTGDGSILMNIQELATLADLKLDVTIIIFINGHLGLVRQQQELFYNKHYMASKFATNPDFEVISKGFGIKSCSINEDSDINKILELKLNEKGPGVICIKIKSDEKVFPMVPPGSGISEMVGGE